MTRKIKFKAKRKDNQEWVYGCGVYNDGVMAFIINYDVDLIEETDEFSHIQVIPETICEYTGLKDKNGVEIYENDMLREYSNEIEDWIVSYEYGKFIGTYDNVCEDLYELSDLEVVGNIYDK